MDWEGRMTKFYSYLCRGIKKMGQGYHEEAKMMAMNVSSVYGQEIQSYFQLL